MQGESTGLLATLSSVSLGMFPQSCPLHYCTWDVYGRPTSRVRAITPFSLYSMEQLLERARSVLPEVRTPDKQIGQAGWLNMAKLKSILGVTQTRAYDVRNLLEENLRSSNVTSTYTVQNFDSISLICPDKKVEYQTKCRHSKCCYLTKQIA